nr:MAG TPA: Heat-labile enterotoxin beta chain [Caudoviricetes sp.]
MMIRIVTERKKRFRAIYHTETLCIWRNKICL